MQLTSYSLRYVGQEFCCLLVLEPPGLFRMLLEARTHYLRKVPDAHTDNIASSRAPVRAKNPTPYLSHHHP